MPEFAIANRKPPYFQAAAEIAALKGLQLRGGRPAVILRGAAALANAEPQTEWVFEGAKSTSINLLDGGEAWLDWTTRLVTYKRTTDRSFYLGLVNGDALAGTTTCQVDLGVEPRWAIDLRRGVWTPEQTDGLGVTLLPGGSCKLAFDAVAEVAQAALISEQAVAVASNPILHARFAVADIGDDAALNMNIGLASGSHATDFQTITAFAALRFKGSDLSFWTESDDGTTDVAAVDSTLNATLSTYHDLWIDVRDPAAVKFYVDGVRVNSGTTFTLAAAAGPLYAIAHQTKTSNDTTADMRLAELRVRTSEQ